MANDFSPRWFSTFLDTLPDEWTTGEVDGVVRRLPLPDYARVLDVCCGPARHASLLAERGYRVTGVDRDAAAIERARVRAPTATFHCLDQRDLSMLQGPFDAAIILWQSFGYFDPRTNDAILADLAQLLRPGGRLLLDLFHPDCVAATEGTEIEARGGSGARIRNRIEEGRLRSTIRYADGATDVMDFELFPPSTLAERAALAGFSLVEQCCWWEENRLPDPAVQRYQSVFERR